jgi:triosephosphate isomerase
MQLLAQHGCRYVLCGHSERRIHHAENDAFVSHQAIAAVEAGLLPIVCVGETADEREMGQAEEVVKRQLAPILKTGVMFIAYEPVWAIGTGKTASSEDAQTMHAVIRGLLPKNTRDDVRILYGGSVKPENAAELIAQEDIDGFLVGNSSLDPVKFRAIVESCTK